MSSIQIGAITWALLIALRYPLISFLNSAIKRELSGSTSSKLIIDHPDRITHYNRCYVLISLLSATRIITWASLPFGFITLGYAVPDLVVSWMTSPAGRLVPEQTLFLVSLGALAGYVCIFKIWKELYVFNWGVLFTPISAPISKERESRVSKVGQGRGASKHVPNRPRHSLE